MITSVEEERSYCSVVEYLLSGRASTSCLCLQLDASPDCGTPSFYHLKVKVCKDKGQDQSELKSNHQNQNF